MRKMIWVCVLLAGCGGSSAHRGQKNEHISRVVQIVVNSLEIARRQAAQFNFFHFVVFSQESIDVYRDNNNDGKIETEKGDLRIQSIPLRLPENNVHLAAPAWYACDARGKPAWSDRSALPPDIIIRDVKTGERVILEMDGKKLRPAKLVIYGPGETDKP